MTTSHSRPPTEIHQVWREKVELETVRDELKSELRLLKELDEKIQIDAGEMIPREIPQSDDEVMHDVTLAAIRKTLRLLNAITKMGAGSRELSLAITKAEEAEMWLHRHLYGQQVV